MHIVMTGNPFDGYEFFGPFDDVDDACFWADRNAQWEWYSVKIAPVNEVKDGNV